MSAATSATSADIPDGKLDERPRSERELLLADRAAQLYSQMPLGVAASILLIAVAVYALRDSRLSWLVYGWSAVGVSVTAARAVLWWGYQRSAGKARETLRWMRRLAVGAFANGALWGVLAALFFELQSDLEHLFILILLTGVMVGGIAMYAASWTMYAVYGAPVVLPFTYNLVMHEQTLFQAVAVLVPLFYAACVGVAYRLQQLFLAGFRSQHAFRRLTAQYTELNQRLAAQIEEIAAARSQVEASGRKLAQFVEASPLGVFELNAEGRANHVNQAAAALFGYADNELAGRAIIESLFPAGQRDALRQRWREMLRTGQPLLLHRQETLRRDGNALICEWSLTPLVNPDGRVISVIAQGRDITQQLEAERLKQEFTSTLSHELRTPLTAILGALQLVNSGALGAPAPEALEMTQIAERNSQRLLELINELLDLEKIESGKLQIEMQTMPLDELVREAILLDRAFADRYKVHLEIASELPSATVRVDRRRVLQILTNLLSNAVKFSPEGATVEVAVQDRGSHLRIGVHDRGPGIPASFRARVFTRFAQADMSHTRHKGGTGLGLAISKRLTELMRGRIGFADREGGGTTFWIELPKFS